MKIEALKTHKAAAEEGRWTRIHGDFECKVKSADSESFRAVQESIMEEFPGITGKELDERSTFALVADWRGYEDANDQPVELDENAFESLCNQASYVRRRIRMFALTDSNFIGQIPDADLGN